MSGALKVSVAFCLATHLLASPSVVSAQSGSVGDRPALSSTDRSASPPSRALHCDDCPVPMIALGPEVPFPLSRMFGTDVPFPMRGAALIGKSVEGKAARIIQAEVIVLNTPVPSLAIMAVGQFNSSGWKLPRLEPVSYIVEPADGIYDFVMYAERPSGLANWVLTYQTAVTLWPQAKREVKGVRIRSDTNAVVAMVRPGAVALADQSLPEPDYKSWVGKRLVRKGETFTGPGEVVREEDIKRKVRILTPNAPFGDDRFEDGRITIIVDEKNIITGVAFG